MIPKVNTPEYKLQLDGLRFICFMGVFTFHHFERPAEWGYFGLYVFFAMSGFLITRILLTAEPHMPTGRLLASYYIRRCLRIFPAYYLLILLLILFTDTPHMLSRIFYVYNIKMFLLSMNTGIVINSDVYQDWGVHFWSLSVEEQFYLGFPLLLIFFRRHRGLLFTFLMIFSVASRIYFSLYFPGTFYGFLLPVCGEYILWGCFFAYLDISGKLKKISPQFLFYASLGLLLLMFTTGTASPQGYKLLVTAGAEWFQTLLAVLTGAFIWSLWHADDLWLSRLLRWPVLVYLGKMTYGLYLVHLFTVQLWSVLTARWAFLNHVPAYPGSLLLTIAYAALSWHLLEEPLSRLKIKVPYQTKPR